MKRKRRMAKADAPSADEIRRLTEMETQFVSLVPRGANRQSEFFVVKADGSTVPPVEPAPTPGPSDAAAAAPPADPGDRPQEKNEPDAPAATPGAPEPTVGEPAPAAASKLDSLAPWLETAGARAQALAMDAVLARALASSPPEPPAPAASVPPPPDEPAAADSAADAALKADLAAARDRIAALEAEVHATRAASEKARADGMAALAKAQHALTVERARVAKLRGSIGQPSALPTGEVPAAAAGGPARAGWAGDLAAQVRAAEQQRAKA